MSDISAVIGKMPERAVDFKQAPTNDNLQAANMTQTQNFEYREEIEFRGEQVEDH